MNDQQSETLPEPPEYLGVEGVKKWREIAVKVNGDMLDLAGMFCASWETFLQAQGDIREHGIVLEGSNGRRWHNPSVSSMLAAQKSFQKLGKALGLDEKKVLDSRQAFARLLA